MVKLIKNIIIAILFILVLPFGLVAKLAYKLLGTQQAFTMFAEGFSMVPGFIGYLSRACYYKQTLAKSHIDFFTAFGTYLSKIECEINENVKIGGRTTIGLCKIGKNTVIANSVSVISGRRQHNFDDPNASVAGETQFQKLEIGENIFVGEKSIVMANIGDKAIIGAGSVVVKDIPPFSIAVGNPCKVVKTREKS